MPNEHEEGLTGGQRELEQALGRLRPARGGLSRDRMLFRAGLAHGRRQGRQWNVALAATVLVAGAAAILAAYRAPQTQVVERLVYRDAPRPAQTQQPQFASARVEPAWRTEFAAVAAQAEYVRLREAVLEKGLDALPAASARAAGEDLSDLWPSLGRAVGRAVPGRAGSGLGRGIFNGGRS